MARTKGAIGDHILKAEIRPVSGETDAADNIVTTTVTIKETAGKKLSRSDLNMVGEPKAVGIESISHKPITVYHWLGSVTKVTPTTPVNERAYQHYVDLHASLDTT